MKKIIIAAVALLTASSHIAIGQCLIDSQKIYLYNPGTEMRELKGIKTFIYNSSGKLVESLISNWDGTNYTPSLKESFEYSSNQNLEQQTLASYNGALATFVNQRRSLYEYNSSNQKTSFITQDYDNANNRWENQDRYIYNFTGTNLTEEIHSTWVGSGASGLFVNAHRQTVEYLPNDSINFVRTFNWNETSNTWDRRYRHQYKYLSTGKLNKIEKNVFVPSIDDWMETFEEVYHYNSQDQLVAIFTLDPGVSVHQATDSFYYLNGKITKHITYIANGPSNTLEQDSMRTIEYTSSGDTSVVENYHNYNIPATYYEDRVRIEYYCAGTTDIANLNPELFDFNIFPNPSNNADQVQVQVAEKTTFTIINSLGQIVATHLLPKGNHLLDIHYLQPGIYYICNQKVSKKLVVVP